MELPIISIVKKYWTQIDRGYMLEDQLTNTLWYRQRTYLSSYLVMLHSTIVKMQHLVKKLANWPWIGKIWHYEQCMPYPLKIVIVDKYMKGGPILTTKEGVGFSNCENQWFHYISLVVEYLIVVCGHYNS